MVEPGGVEGNSREAPLFRSVICRPALHRMLFCVLVGIVSAGALAARSAASPYTLHILHPFCAKASCADGSSPQYGLIADNKGVLYGTTAFGGSGDSGVVYAL